jgi:cytochrome d ubiquinol oxidase subunit II
VVWLLRPLAVGAFVSVIWGWFVAQYPFLIPGQLTISDAAGASASLTAVLVVFVAAAVLVLPSLALLYVLSQRDVLE